MDTQQVDRLDQERQTEGEYRRDAARAEKLAGSAAGRALALERLARQYRRLQYDLEATAAEYRQEAALGEAVRAELAGEVADWTPVNREAKRAEALRAKAAALAY